MIFGIGLSKTGTTSLFAALDELGYRAGTYRHMRLLGLDDWFRGDFTYDYLTGFDALTDLPLASFYPQLDRRYPGSKFVLTVRDLDSWIASARTHFEREPASEFGRRVRLLAYGTDGFDPATFRRVYETHVREVHAYFQSRPNDLLTFNLVGGEGWAPLCAFLNRAIPERPFPDVKPGYVLPSERAQAGTTS